MQLRQQGGGTELTRMAAFATSAGMTGAFTIAAVSRLVRRIGMAMRAGHVAGMSGLLLSINLSAESGERLQWQQAQQQIHTELCHGRI